MQLNTKYWIFQGLAINNNLQQSDVEVLLAIHDQEIISNIPDKSKLKIYIDCSDDLMSHSYIYDNKYLFTTRLLKVKNYWKIYSEKIDIYQIIKLMILNLILPYSSNEIVWIYQKLNDYHISKSIKYQIYKMIDSLSEYEKIKLYSHMLLLKV